MGCSGFYRRSFFLQRFCRVLKGLTHSLKDLKRFLYFVHFHGILNWAWADDADTPHLLIPKPQGVPPFWACGV